MRKLSQAKNVVVIGDKLLITHTDSETGKMYAQQLDGTPLEVDEAGLKRFELAMEKQAKNKQ